jgi:hypothetical protein
MAAAQDASLADAAAVERTRLLSYNAVDTSVSSFGGVNAPLVLPFRPVRDAAGRSRAGSSSSMAVDDEDEDVVPSAGSRRGRKRGTSASSKASKTSPPEVPLPNGGYHRPLEVGGAVLGSNGRWREGEISLLSGLDIFGGSALGSGGCGGEADAGGAAARPALPGRTPRRGRYRLYASGRAEIVVSGVAFDVTTGVPRQHFDQLVAVTRDGRAAASRPNEFVPLGPVHTHLVAAVRLEELQAAVDAGVGATGRRRLIEEFLNAPIKD